MPRDVRTKLVHVVVSWMTLLLVTAGLCQTAFARSRELAGPSSLVVPQPIFIYDMRSTFFATGANGDQGFGHLGASLRGNARLNALLIATRGVAAVAPKLLSAIPSRIANAANHIFGSNLAKHKLGGVLGAFKGDATAATYALENATQALANQGAISGVFKGTVVEIAGFSVTVQGRVMAGVAHLSTAFIP